MHFRLVLSDRITDPLYADMKGWSAEDAVLVGLHLGRFPNRALTVIVMMECCPIHNACVGTILLYRMSGRFSTGFFIFFSFLEELQK